MGTTRSVLAGGKFATWVAFFLVASQKCAAAADWKRWDQPQVQQGNVAWGNPWGQQGGVPYDQISLPYPPQHSSLQSFGNSPGSLYQASPANGVFEPASADQLSLGDLPVDAETTSVGSATSSVNPDHRKQKRKSSLLQVFVNFFKKPKLFKILVAVGVMLASFFLVGIFARIAQFVFGIWLTLKVLEFFENQQD